MCSFTTLTMNTQPLHLDAAISDALLPFHARLVNSMFTLSTLVGLGRAADAGHARGQSGLLGDRLPRPRLHRRHLVCRDLVTDKRPSRSRPGEGIEPGAHRAQ